MPWNGTVWTDYAILGDRNVTTFVDIMQYNNDITGGLMGILMLVTIFTISYMSASYKRSGNMSLAFASMLTMVSAVLLDAVDVIGTEVMWISVMVLMGAIALVYVRGGDN